MRAARALLLFSLALSCFSRGSFADELQAGIVCSGMNGGSHEASLEMMQLFAEEVMPYFREDAEVDETAGIGR